MWSRHVLCCVVDFYTNNWTYRPYFCITVYTVECVCTVCVVKWRVFCSFQVPLISVASFFFMKNESAFFCIYPLWLKTRLLINLTCFLNLRYTCSNSLCESGTKTFNCRHSRVRKSLWICWPWILLMKRQQYKYLHISTRNSKDPVFSSIQTIYAIKCKAQGNVYIYCILSLCSSALV